ncbi:MAG: hypothetical protein OXH77_06740 [Anaerolineaceae bacterium]|nr:hypothetical protein [Anaerolineaceae bacterium]
MNPALQLYQLQQLEQSALQARRRLQVIAQELADDAEIQYSEALCQEIRDLLRPLRNQLRDLELETAGNEEKIRSTGELLYSGTVKSPREMQDMQLEVASLTRRNGDLETRSLETMLAIEEAESRMAEAEQALREVIGRRGDAHHELILERDTLVNSLPDLERQRKGALENIQPELQRQYEALKPRKGGQPVARMEGNSCTLCGVAQNITAEREVQQGRRLVTCTNCGRILVAVTA